MVDKGLSRFIPGEVHEAHRPVAASAWEVAVAGVRGGNLVERHRLARVLGFSISFHAGWAGPFLGGPLLFVGSPPSAWSP